LMGSRHGVRTPAILSVLLLTVFAISAVSPPSSASTAEYTPPQYYGGPCPEELTPSVLSFVAGDEVNKLNVVGLIGDIFVPEPSGFTCAAFFSEREGVISFQDAAAKITAGTGCKTTIALKRLGLNLVVASIGNRVVCDVGPERLVIDLGGGNDYLALSLISVVKYDFIPDVFTQFATISAGPGNDTLRTVNGASDAISCGPGDDTIVADQNDVVDADCEHVTRL
jgi:hypothetical protein